MNLRRAVGLSQVGWAKWAGNKTSFTIITWCEKYVVSKSYHSLYIRNLARDVESMVGLVIFCFVSKYQKWSKIEILIHGGT